MYPVSYEADFQSEQNRATTFFRIILAIPWFIVAFAYQIVALFSHLFAWVAVVILGRYPEGLSNLNSGLVRSSSAPPPGSTCRPTSGRRSGSPTTNYPIRVNFAGRDEKQSRLKAFFRIILALPMLIVSYQVSYMHLWIGVIAWLTIVFRGYLPEERTRR